MSGPTLPGRPNRYKVWAYYFCEVFDNLIPLTPGAIGFDRMATVVVACRGRSLGLLKNVSKTSTANTSDVAGRVGFGAPLAIAA